MNRSKLQATTQIAGRNASYGPLVAGYKRRALLPMRTCALHDSTSITTKGATRNIMKVYLDNSSTTWPKPPGVTRAVTEYLEDVGCNLNRTGFGTSCVLNKRTREARVRLARLFNYPTFQHVVFTPGITISLNIVIKGLLRPGDHVLISSMEHNAVTRPLFQMRKRGVEFDMIPCASIGELDPGDIAPLIRPSTRALVTIHGSNVCGTILPIEQMGQVAKEHGLLFVVDTAQTAGVLELDMVAQHIDILCFAAHKGLLGPPGVGGLVIPPELAQQIEPLWSGGTGMLSEMDEMPQDLPMHFEAGTPNLMGYYGLCASLRWLERVGTQRIHEHESELYRHFLAGMQQLDGVRIHGTQNTATSLAVLAITTPGRDIGKVAYRLDRKHKVITRCGLHCAPWANRTLGTWPVGTIRFSLGYFTKKRELDYTLAALEESLTHVRIHP
ncbi:MAG: aminotransferase class V-fold PLP-dependent enzyme [Coriobacteriales bacterium]|nr:aminotransferase class V-fold PLP-dependent enzyme [Coriobacteriales bacterium]